MYREYLCTRNPMKSKGLHTNRLGMRIVWLLIVLSCTVNQYFTLSAQGDFGIVLGISNYQGDLASYNTASGFKALIGPVVGVHYGHELNDHFNLRANLQYLRIAGDDAFNANSGTRERNLSFFAPVIQFYAGGDLNIFRFSTSGENLFTPYITAGAGLFYFNPKTWYQGEKIALHPLGTEGQYLDDYPDQKPYSLWQPSLQIGGGLKLITSEKLILAGEIMMTYTFTDYLDDVSTIYISYTELAEKAGPLTAALANRQGEFLGTEPTIVPTGSPRANSESRDYFGTITLRATFPVGSPDSRYKVRVTNRRKIKCPKF